MTRAELHSILNKFRVDGTASCTATSYVLKKDGEVLYVKHSISIVLVTKDEDEVQPIYIEKGK